MMTGVAYAQECGPSCPVCSGAGNNDGALLPQKSLMVSGMIISAADEEKFVVNTRVGILSWLDAGVGCAVKTDKVLWNLRAQPVAEQEEGRKFGLIVGTGSVQTGGSDQSAYAQLIKSWEISEFFGFRFSDEVATLVPDFDELYGLTGITASFKEQYAAFANYDGESLYGGFAWIPSDRLTVSFLMVETEYPVFSITFKR